MTQSACNSNCLTKSKSIIPFHELQKNPNLILGTPAYGGHLGFFENLKPQQVKIKIKISGMQDQ